jgi:hypothetical protein
MITPAFKMLDRRADALYVCSSDPLVHANQVRINTLALAARLPTIYANREHVETAGLMSYGPNVPDLFRRAGDYVDKILRGSKPTLHRPFAMAAARQGLPRRKEYWAAHAGGPRAQQAGKLETRALFAASQGGTVARAGSNTCAPRSVRLDLIACGPPSGWCINPFKAADPREF